MLDSHILTCFFSLPIIFPLIIAFIPPGKRLPIYDKLIFVLDLSFLIIAFFPSLVFPLVPYKYTSGTGPIAIALTFFFYFFFVLIYQCIIAKCLIRIPPKDQP